jgi:hypothetical protein
MCTYHQLNFRCTGRSRGPGSRYTRITKIVGPCYGPNSFHPQTTGNTTVTERSGLCVNCENEKREKEKVAEMLLAVGKGRSAFPKPPPPPQGRISSSRADMPADPGVCEVEVVGGSRWMLLSQTDGSSYQLRAHSFRIVRVHQSCIRDRARKHLGQNDLATFAMYLV